MKTINAIVKVLTALATIAGAVYIIATYGDQIVAWAKEIWKKLPSVTVDIPAAEEAAPAPAEEAAAEEVVEPTAGEAPVEEAPAEEHVEEAIAPMDENAPVADESDFEG